MRFEASHSPTNSTGELRVTKFPASDGRLAYTSYVRAGLKPHSRAVLLHGFTQSSESFRSIACALSLSRPVETICVDLPFHGGSVDVNADLTQAAELLYDFGSDAIWFGYSLGARHLLTLCLRHPENRWKAIFSGVNPGIEDEEERQRRYLSDLALARELRLLDRDQSGFREFLDRWTALPVFQPRNALSEDVEARLANSPEGLARSLENSSVGVQPNLWPLLSTLRGEVVLLTGACDSKYLQIAEVMESMLATSADVVLRRKTIDGLGHSAVFDRPDLVVEAIVSLTVR